ncbi:A24 family peptidase [Sphingomonas sp. dw_22]|uniref:prepilin peptidase n=1 Tax=Sphingomonas sp. dw_22 TaxID=2721175 RepID=UPI001BD28F6A|nr:A24 family peptidase [Sphingomonas sp. dw_22]
MLVLLLGFLGFIVGSFIAVLVIRWPQGRGSVFGRSCCDSCGRTLSPAELIPIVSAAVQRHRCRSCSARIPSIHWQIETAAAVIGVLAGISAPLFQAIAGAVFGWLLLALAAIDLTALLLPNALTAALALTGLGLGLTPQLSERLIGGLAGFVVLWGVKGLYRALRGREGLGAGDPKLLGAIGCWLGWRALPQVLLGASLLGLGYVLIERMRGNRLAGDHRLPFGAALAAAGFLAWGASSSVASAWR